MSSQHHHHYHYHHRYRYSYRHRHRHRYRHRYRHRPYRRRRVIIVIVVLVSSRHADKIYFALYKISKSNESNNNARPRVFARRIFTFFR